MILFDGITPWLRELEREEEVLEENQGET